MEPVKYLHILCKRTNNTEKHFPKNIVKLESFKKLFLESPCNGTVVGRVKNKKLNELSGLAESHRFPGIFYAIEDSGNEPVVYIINEDGSLRGQLINFKSIFCSLILKNS